MFTEILQKHIKEWKRNKLTVIIVLIIDLVMLSVNIFRVIYCPNDEFALFGMILMITAAIVMVVCWWFSNKELNKSKKIYEDYIKSKGSSQNGGT